MCKKRFNSYFKRWMYLCFLLLDKLGIDSIIIEKELSLDTQPKAHVIYQSSIELFKEIGIGASEIKSIEVPKEWWPTMYYFSKNFRVRETYIGSLTSKPSKDKNFYTHIPQNRLVSLLKEKVDQSKHSTIQFDYELKKIQQTSDSLECICTHNNGKAVSIGSRYLIGADGASSFVRSHLDIPSIGKKSLLDMIAIDVKANLSPLIDDTRSVLFRFLDIKEHGLAIVYDSFSNFIYHRPYYPEYENKANYTIKRCRKIIQYITQNQLNSFEINSVNIWKMSAQYAQQFRVKNVFLAGDAAHQLPPTGAMGLNTGFLDVFLLTHILAKAIVNNDSKKLELYEHYCQPLAIKSIQLAHKNFENTKNMFLPLGLDPEKAKIIPWVFSLPIIRHFPDIIKGVITKILTIPIRFRINSFIKHRRFGTSALIKTIDANIYQIKNNYTEAHEHLMEFYDQFISVLELNKSPLEKVENEID